MSSKVSFKKVISASFVMLGSIIGAGILGIPYVVAQTGWWLGFAYIVLIGLISLLVNLAAGEVASRVKGYVHLPGYVERFLGKKYKQIMTLSIAISIYGALLAYMIALGDIFFDLTNFYSAKFWSLALFLFFGLAIFRGINFIEHINSWLVYILLIFIIIITILAFKEFNYTNITYINWSKMFLPYGVLLFAYGGSMVLPTVEQMVNEEEKAFRKSIIIANVIPIFVYSLFTLAVIGVTGINTTQIATNGLGTKVGALMIIFGNLFAILAMSTSYLALGVTMKNMWQWDMKFSNFWGTVLTLIVPLVIFLSGWDDFISVLSFFGALGSGILMILIALVFNKVDKVKNDVKIKSPLKMRKLIVFLLIFVAIVSFGSTLFELIIN